MISLWLLVAAGVVVLVIVAYLLGCGGGKPANGGAIRLNSARSVQLTKSPGVPVNDYRWKDVAGNLYAAGFASSFDYATSPTVTVTFDDGTETLEGTIDAAGLKPNFAYQIKLIGKPAAMWGATGDDAANERIGYVGRWWSDLAGNVNDAYYEAHHDSEPIAGYIVMGFLITDEDGRANVNWRLESSYHVLWNTNQRSPNTNDGPSQTRTLDFTSWGYGLPYPTPTTQTIFPEWETGRPTPKKARLPVGSYKCLFALYEESFHDAPDGAGPGGNWAKAMEFAGLSFEVLEP